MRYGLQWAESDPFPHDLEVGVQLEPEPVEVVPEPCEECPECPPACEVACQGWGYAGTNVVPFTNSGFLRESSGDQTLGAVHNGTGNSTTLFLVGEFCGHRLRITVSATGMTSPTHYTATKISVFGTGSEVGVVLAFTSSAPTHGSGYVDLQAQIDLTDAAPGLETWTNICLRVRVQPTAR